MIRVKVNVTFQPGVGYISLSNHVVARSLTALSLEGLRRRVIVATALRRREGEEISVQLELDAAARAEVGRRAAVNTGTRVARHTLPTAACSEGNSGQLGATSCLKLP
jgi:hypothetical protein